VAGVSSLGGVSVVGVIIMLCECLCAYGKAKKKSGSTSAGHIIFANTQSSLTVK
jgi:hypothetical protein